MSFIEHDYSNRKIEDADLHRSPVSISLLTVFKTIRTSALTLPNKHNANLPTTGSKVHVLCHRIFCKINGI